MTNKQKLATKIAAALFDSTWDGRAVRLQRKLPPENWSGRLNYNLKQERDGGGWCFDAAVNCILKVLGEK